MNSQLDKTGELVSTYGTNMAIVIIFLSCFLLVFSIAAHRYFKSQDEQKERDDRNNQIYIELIRQMTEAITRNTIDVSDFKEGLKEHTKLANDNFKEINSDLDDIKGQVSDIARKSDDLATKNDLSEVERKIDEMRSQLKKD